MKTPTPDSNPSRPWASSLLRKACGLLSLPLLAATTLPLASAYTVPNTSDLLFSVNTDSLPASGNIGNWAATAPAAGIFNTIGTPTVDNVGTTPVKWEKNLANGTGFYSNWLANSPQQIIPVNGVSAVAAVKPVSGHSNDRNWTPVIDILFGAFRLGVRNDTRVVILTVSTSAGVQTQINSTYTIPDGQSTILSAVVQPSGSYQVWANGVSIMTGAGVGVSTQLKPNAADTRRTVCLGTSQDDTSATINGDIGDVLMWKVALADVDRQALETALMAKFHAGASYTPSTVTASSTGSGGTISPSGTTTVQYEADLKYTITKNYGYLCDVVVDSVSQGDLSSYTFNDVVAAHTIAANYTLLSTRTISGKVTAATGGAPISGATVSVRYTSGALASQTAISDASGNYTMIVPTGTYYLCASKTSYLISAESAVNASGDQTINFALTQKLHLNGAVRNIPQMENLLFAADTNDMGAVDTQGNWPTFYCTYPGISTLTAIVSPLVQKQRGLKYDYNLRADSDGYRLNTASVQNSIPTSGASVVCLVKPIRNATSDGYNSLIDIFYSNLILGIKNNTGQIQVRRNGTDYWSANDTAHTIPDGQMTILSLVLQSSGNFSVWSSAWNNTTKTFGTPTVMMSSTDASSFTAFVPAQAGADDFRKWINVGRNNPDGWSTINAYIGDVFVYKTALSTGDRTTLEGDLQTKMNSIATWNITASAGASGTISPAGVTAVGDGDNQTYTITPNFGYDISSVLVDGTNNLAAVSSGTYTFTTVSAIHTIAASFVAKPTYAISGQVTDSLSGSPIAGVKVYVSTTANASYLPYYTLTTDDSGNYSVNLFNATWYVCASAKGYSTSADSTVSVAGAAQSGKNFSLVASGRNIPQMDQLLFALYGNALTASGATTNAWPLEHPKGRTAPIIGAPTLASVDGVQWESNRYTSGDGYTIGNYSAAIPINGLTATAVVQPQGDGVNGGNWASVIDVMYNRFVLAIRGTDGALRVERNGTWTNGPVIPNGQKTVLTAVVQPTGQYVVYANGVQVMQDTTTSAMTTLDPYWNGGGLGFWSYITVGRNFPDGWTTYKGNIDSAFLWKTVLSASERVAFETELGTTVGIAMPVFHNITASAGTGGTISPSGVVQAADSGNETFTITASNGYRIAQVLVDGVNNATAVSTGTYTFPTVTTTHTIDASFVPIVYHDITASAGSNGTISPTGTTPVEEGTSKTFTITPVDAGYRIAQVLVDGVNNPTAVATGTYTFPTVTTTHTIDASFVAIVYHDITASAGSNGTISPAGTTPVEDGTSKTFTITPLDAGYRIAQVWVDGVNDPTAVSTGTYTFSAVTTTHTIAATFVVRVQRTVSGKVTDKMTGADVAGASVYFSTTPNAKTSPVLTATTNASGNYSQVVYEGSYYLASDATNYYTSADTALYITGDTTNNNLALIPTVRNIPRTSDLLFSVVTDTLPSSGATGPWATYLPSGQTLASIANPQAEVIDGVKWERNTALTSIAPDVWKSDGFRLATYTDPIPVNGASAVIAVRPVRNTKDTSWVSVVDVMYNRMVVGVYNHTGQVVAYRNGLLVNSGSYTIPDGQKTVLSMVVQPTGEFKVYANGVAVITNTTTSDMTALVPNVPGGYANAINLGRNNPDGWTAFNGDIGDAFLYKVALSASERSQVETDVASKFGITMQHSITSSADPNGTITPLGTTQVADASSQAYSITPASGFFVDVVTVDGVAQSGHPTSYTFTHVTGDHTISATFTATLNPYAEWTNRFTFAVGADQTPTGDPDGDGMTNQQEYAFGLDPTKGSSCDPIVAPLNKDTRTFSYTRYATSGLGYTVWTSLDLKTWTQDTTASQVPGTTDPVTGVEVVAVTLTGPLPSDTKLFVRVQAE